MAIVPRLLTWASASAGRAACMAASTMSGKLLARDAALGCGEEIDKGLQRRGSAGIRLTKQGRHLATRVVEAQVGLVQQLVSLTQHGDLCRIETTAAQALDVDAVRRGLVAVLVAGS